MPTLKVITDATFGIERKIPESYLKRTSSRGIVFDQVGNVALFHGTKKNYYKLPGGGVNEGESIEEALHRELREEIGCAITDIRPVGMIEEYRDQINIHQISHCFMANVLGEKGEPTLEADEIEEGFVTVWVPLSEAINLVETHALTSDYKGKFMYLRELTFLSEAKRLIEEMA